MVLLGVGLLTGCGMKSFSDSFAVVVDEPQRVSVFDSRMGQSAEWAAKTMGQAAPGRPYVTEVANLEAKMFFDGSPPASIQIGLFLPDLADDGYYAITLNEVTAGTMDYEAVFVPWYSETPVDPRPAMSLVLDIAAGANGWIVNVTLGSAA